MCLTYSYLGKKERKWIATFPIAPLTYSTIFFKLEIYKKVVEISVGQDTSMFHCLLKFC